MSVGILLITHDDIGSSLLDSLQQMLAGLPMAIKVLPVRHEDEPLEFCYHAERLCDSLNRGQGVLVLTDLFGATPCNIACSLIQNHRVRVVCGVNLPMLIKIMSNPSADLDRLVNIAVSGGCQGVLDINKTISKEN